MNNNTAYLKENTPPIFYAFQRYLLGCTDMVKSRSIFKFYAYIIGFVLLIVSSVSFSSDIIRFESGQSKTDSRMAYKRKIILTAMEKTTDTYGPYVFFDNAPQMNSLRALREMENGELINVFIALTNKNWEAKTIPIRIPIRRGVLNYRLLLTNKDSLSLFNDIKSAEDLMLLSAGLRRSWTTASVMEELGYTIVSTSGYDALFSMLDTQRFDYIPRGINEIYGELEMYQDTLKNITIEPDLALHIPGPSYIFVSPKYPRLAKRILEGLEIMIEDGSFEAIFNAHFDEYIQKADLKNRMIIDVGNPLLPQSVPFGRKELWWTPE